jgi:serine protease Do
MRTLHRLFAAAALVAALAVPASAAPGWLGIATQSTSEDLRKGLDLTRDGLLVDMVSPGSPAEKAGVKKGDVLLSLDGKPVADPMELRRLVRDVEAGRTVTLEVWREGAARKLTATLGEVPGDDDESGPGDEDGPRVTKRIIVNGRELPPGEGDDMLERFGLGGGARMRGMPGRIDVAVPRGALPRTRLGVRLEKLSSDLAQAMGVTDTQGALVVEVMADTPAQKAGVKAGDVVVKVGTEAIADPAALMKAITGKDGKVELTLSRKGVRRVVTAELGGRAPGAGVKDDGMRDERRVEVRVFDDDDAPDAPPALRGRGGPGGPGGADEEIEDLRHQLRQLRAEVRRLRIMMMRAHAR